MFEEIIINKKKENELARHQALSTWWEEDEEIGDSDFFWMLGDRDHLSSEDWRLRLWKVYKPLLEAEEARKRAEEGNIFVDKDSGIEISLERIIAEIESDEMKTQREEAQEKIKSNEIDYWKSLAESAWKLNEEIRLIVQKGKEKVKKIKEIVCRECEDRIAGLEGYEKIG